MFTTVLKTNETGRKRQSLPPVGQHVVVHCPGYSCLGYVDPNGTWRSVFTEKDLPEVIDFTPIG